MPPPPFFETPGIMGRERGALSGAPPGMTEIRFSNTRDLIVGDVIEVMEGTISIDTHRAQVMAVDANNVHALVIYSTRSQWADSGITASNEDKKWLTIPQGPREMIEKIIPTKVRSITVYRPVKAGDDVTFKSLKEAAVALGLDSAARPIAISKVGDLLSGDYFYSGGHRLSDARTLYRIIGTKEDEPAMLRAALVASMVGMAHVATPGRIYVIAKDKVPGPGEAAFTFRKETRLEETKFSNLFFALAGGSALIGLVLYLRSR